MENQPHPMTHPNPAAPQPTPTPELDTEREDLPTGWVETTLGELNTYKSATVDPAAFPDEVFELYSVPIFPTGKPEHQKGSDIGSTKQTVNPDDVLICKINPRINRVWKVNEAGDERQIGSSEWIVFRSPNTYADFYKHFFRSPDFREKLCQDLTGVGGSLTRAQPARVATFSLPLPPLPEQIRIADKLDTLLARVEAARARLERVPALLGRFRQSVLSAAVSGELTREWRGGGDAEWEEVTLGEVIKVSSGKFLPAKAMVEGGQIPVYGGNGVNGYHNESNVSSETIVIGRVGFYCGSVHLTPEKAWVTDNALIVSFSHENFDTKYLFNLLTATDLRQNDSSTAQPVISGQKIYGIKVSLPSLTEQAEIVRRVEALFSIADRAEARYREALRAFDSLTPALLQKAFRGELVPQDPNDEPASVLLERIRAQRAASGEKRGRGAGQPKAQAAAAAEGEPVKRRGRPRKVAQAQSVEEAIRQLEVRKAGQEPEFERAEGTRQVGLFED